MCCVTWLRLSTWRWSVVISGVRVACAIEVRVVACDGPLPPVNLFPLVVHIIPTQPQDLSCLCLLVGPAMPQQMYIQPLLWPIRWAGRCSNLSMSIYMLLSSQSIQYASEDAAHVLRKFTHELHGGRGG